MGGYHIQTGFPPSSLGMFGLPGQQSPAGLHGQMAMNQQMGINPNALRQMLGMDGQGCTPPPDERCDYCGHLRRLYTSRDSCEACGVPLK